jgi:hypothetical protein
MRTKKTKMRKTRKNKIRKSKKIGGAFFIKTAARLFWRPEPIDISVLRMKIIKYLGKYRNIKNNITNGTRNKHLNSYQYHRNMNNELTFRGQILAGVSSPGLYAGPHEHMRYKAESEISQSRWNNAYTAEQKAKAESNHTLVVHQNTIQIDNLMDSLISLLNRYWSTHLSSDESPSIFIVGLYEAHADEPIVDIDKLNEYFELYETAKKSHMQHELLQLNQVVLKIETLENEIALSKR